MPNSSYDVVILGNGLGSLITAALCARRGLRTLHLAPDDVQERYLLGPHRLPLEPMLWPSRMAWAGERVLKELSLELALRRKLREPRVSAQVVAPDLRFELGDSMAKELARELGTERGEQWTSEWQTLAELGRPLDAVMTGEQLFPHSGFLRRETAKVVDKAGVDAEQAWRGVTSPILPSLAKAIAALWMRHPEPPPVAVGRALDACRGGLLPLRGDAEALRELVLEKLTGAGGEARVGKVRELTTSWGKISSVIVGNEEIGAGQVVAAIPPREVAALLGKKAPKKLGELGESTRVVGYRYTINIVLDAAGVPDAMAPTVFVLDDPARPPCNDNAFSVHCGEPDDSGHVVVSLAAVLATQGPIDDEVLRGRSQELRVALLTKLDDVMPFYDRHVVVGHSPYDGLPPSTPSGPGTYEAPKGMPLPMRPVMSGELADTAGTGALAYPSPFKNLTFTGGQILPQLGLEGELCAAWNAARIAAGIAGKKRDFLRDEVVAGS
ncbi:MAG TPA: hypothetical protein PKU97_16020 [Kofleriaceae bacterium]|jgi:hypothetical protein|nr:hypothetical protein [Kofleriaceae bacterium]